MTACLSFYLTRQVDPSGIPRDKWVKLPTNNSFSSDLSLPPFKSLLSMLHRREGTTQIALVKECSVYESGLPRLMKSSIGFPFQTTPRRQAIDTPIN
ncbi:hypothetical protein MJO28_011937 [Puccinia striiformis f. sp. tritici]|uniref:Uncharacterized protein n=1 Tax=Puccinia striiformis f. sp. tritici TaxID=168172 RepID=A0ACC0DYW2_9BASI|nr:hypothetical protein MJO28_011937 [Puccinia striiformis f. sp. tritici]